MAHVPVRNWFGDSAGLRQPGDSIEMLAGKYQHGDAFFANYEIITSFSIKL